MIAGVFWLIPAMVGPIIIEDGAPRVLGGAVFQPWWGGGAAWGYMDSVEVHVVF